MTKIPVMYLYSMCLLKLDTSSWKPRCPTTLFILDTRGDLYQLSMVPDLRPYSIEQAWTPHVGYLRHLWRPEARHCNAIWIWLLAILPFRIPICDNAKMLGYHRPQPLHWEPNSTFHPLIITFGAKLHHLSLQNRANPPSSKMTVEGIATIAKNLTSMQ